MKYTSALKKNEEGVSIAVWLLPLLLLLLYMLPKQALYRYIKTERSLGHAVTWLKQDTQYHM